MLLTVSFSLSAQKPTITVWGRATFVPETNQFLERKISEWAKLNDVNVNYTLIPESEFITKIHSAVQAGNQPDVVIHGYPVGEFAHKGLLLPLDDIIDKLGREDIYEVKIEQNRWHDGKIYGIPSFFEPYWLIVRKDVLDQHGLDIPFTLEELAAVSKAITKPDEGFYALGHTLGRDFDANVHMATIFHAYGGGILRERSIKGLDVFKEAPIYKALTYLKDLYDAGTIPPEGSISHSAGNNMAFIQNQIAMTFNPSTIYTTLREQYPEMAAVTVVAPFEVLIDGGVESCFVFNSTRYPELAKDLVYYFFKDKEDYRKYLFEVTDLYGLPIFKSQVKILSDQYKKGKWQCYTVDPVQFLEESKLYLCNPTTYPLNQATALKDSVHYSYFWADLAVDVVLGNMTIEAAVDKAYNRLVGFARDLGYPEK
jgi:ABC-type glycerol-3-phosphate transport system substrate-binding protein